MLLQRVLLTTAASLLVSVSASQASDLDNIMYNVRFENMKPDIDFSVEEKDDRLISMVSKNNEQYTCVMPIEKEQVELNVLGYTGPSAAQLIDKLYGKDHCSMRMEPYWIYEVCHGQYVVQYHKTTTGAKTAEYFLGNKHIDYVSMSKTRDSLTPPTRLIGDEEKPYYLVHYSKGTSCDITGKPRTADVFYVCDTASGIHQITEVTSCHYEVIVKTSALCSHPAYKTAEKQNLDIVCYNKDEDADEPKPAALIEEEQEPNKNFKKQYELTHEERDTDVEREEDEAILAMQKAMEQKLMKKLEKDSIQYRLSGPKRFHSVETQANDDQLVADMVNNFFSGKECFVAVEGWWSYEICYGTKITQFHVGPNNDRIDIVLGVFDHEEQTKFAAAGTEPVIVKNYKSVREVRTFYGDGDYCEDSKNKREVVVRLRCEEVGGSAMHTAIMIREPTPCVYVLSLTSARFCEAMQYVNDEGMIEVEEIPTIEIKDKP